MFGRPSVGFLAGLLGFGLACPAQAAPTLAGTSGLIITPTAEVADSGVLLLGFSWIGGPGAIMMAPKPNRMYFATLGLLPGFELTLDMLQVVGWIDPQAPGVASAFHRLSHLKYRLPLPEAWPMIALGVQDPASVNALTRGPQGQTNYGLMTLYGVCTVPVGPVALSLGYGSSQGFIQGFFGGAEWSVGYGLKLQVDHDSRRMNWGASWQPLDWFGLRVARLQPDDWSAGIWVRWLL